MVNPGAFGISLRSVFEIVKYHISAPSIAAEVFDNNNYMRSEQIFNLAGLLFVGREISRSIINRIPEITT